MRRPASGRREPGTLARSTALLVAGATFMELLDGTALTTAAPRVAASFGQSSAAMAVPISAYLVTVAAFIPLGGWIVDRYGGRKTFAVAVIVFTLASALCAAAPSLAALVGARIVQGVGGALMVPVGRLVVLRDIRRDEVIRAVALFTWPALAAPLLGPVIGGILATYTSWRWIFLLNLPLGVLALCSVGTISAATGPRRRLDVRGWWSSAACAGCVTAAAAVFAIPGSNLPIASACLAIGVVSGAVAVHRLLTAEHPLVSLEALHVRTFRIAHAGGGVFRVVCNAVAFLVPLLFVDAFGWTPAHAGEVLVALFAGNLGIKPATTPLLHRFGFRIMIIGSVCGLALTVALMAALTPGTPLVLTLVLLTASGVLRSTGFTAYNTIAFADVEPALLADANTLSSAISQLAVGLGAAAGALALRLALLLDPHESYRMAFLFVAASLAIPIVEGVLLPRSAGSNLTRRATPETEPAPVRG